jgi:hypothetical protein
VINPTLLPRCVTAQTRRRRKGIKEQEDLHASEDEQFDDNDSDVNGKEEWNSYGPSATLAQTQRGPLPGLQSFTTLPTTQDGQLNEEPLPPTTNVGMSQEQLAKMMAGIVQQQLQSATIRTVEATTSIK